MSQASVTARVDDDNVDPLMTPRMIMLVIIGLMAGMFLSALDQTIVSTSIRTIGDDLNGLSQQAWVTTAYLMVSTIATPIYGKLSDIFGRRPLFIFAIGVFVLGSVLASFSQSMGELAVFRAVQGLGAGGLMSMPLAIMGDILAPRERAKYQGYFLAVFGISSVVGPLVGGLFAGADQILWIDGWRWVFLINVPIGILAMAIVLRFLHIPRQHAPAVRIDWWGAAAVIAALVPLLLVAEQGREWGWTSPAALLCYVVGGIGLAVFLIVETLMKDDALVPMKLFRSSTFSMASLIGALVGFGMFGGMMTLPLYLQIVLGATPTESGLQMLPMILGLMIASIVSGQLIARTGRYRAFPIVGTAFMALAFFWLTHVKYDDSYWFLAGAMLLLGLGLGQLMQTLTIASQNSVGARDMGVATSASTFFRQIGGTLGTAVLVSLLFAALPINIQSSFSDATTTEAALDAALDPTVSSAPENAGIMNAVYAPLAQQIVARTTEQLQGAVSQAQDAAREAVQEQVDAGKIPAAAQDAATAAALEQALAAASDQITSQVPVARVGSDGTVTLDFSDPTARAAFVADAVDAAGDSLSEGGGSVDSSALEDTSFLTGADSRLAAPILIGFNASVVTVYTVAMYVMIVAFVLSLFFRTPPLRARSALEEARAEAREAEEAEAVPAAL